MITASNLMLSTIGSIDAVILHVDDIVLRFCKYFSYLIVHIHIFLIFVFF